MKPLSLIQRIDHAIRACCNRTRAHFPCISHGSDLLSEATCYPSVPIERSGLGVVNIADMIVLLYCLNPVMA